MTTDQMRWKRRLLLRPKCLFFFAGTLAFFFDIFQYKLFETCFDASFHSYPLCNVVTGLLAFASSNFWMHQCQQRKNARMDILMTSIAVQAIALGSLHFTKHTWTVALPLFSVFIFGSRFLVAFATDVVLRQLSSLDCPKTWYAEQYVFWMLGSMLSNQLITNFAGRYILSSR